MSKKEVVTEELINAENGEIESEVAVEKPSKKTRLKGIVETVVGICAIFGGGFIIGQAIGGRPRHEDPVDEVVETEEEN